ncbi:MAG: glycoside hydrolase family 16 protein [Bacteroidetes bacterium]|nr:glycoside hydrolase family 16 protein [Bacteroidota bacterium]
MEAILIALLLFLASCGTDPDSKSDDSTSTEPKLVWSDEFNYEGLPDSTKWTHETGGHGWGNNELQYYTAGRRQNANVINGKLYITARFEEYEGKLYTSARLVTRGKGDWTYGRIDVKAKLPKGTGTWPAIWMLGSNIGTAGWPTCGEIDIMEHVGYDQGWVHASVHTDTYNHVKGTQRTAKVFSTDVSTDFHVYSLRWTADSISVYMDDNKYFTFKKDTNATNAEWPFNKPQFLLLNIAVGGNWGGVKGVDQNAFPAVMEVDYVRVYR